MNILLGSNVISGWEVLWLLFLYVGFPILVLIGGVALVVWVAKTNKK
jgi:hypothetical protein